MIRTRSLALLILLVSLSCKGDVDESLEAQPPFKTAKRFQEDEIYLHMLPGESVDSVVSMETFEGLSPGMTLREVEEVLGPASDSGLSRKGRDQYWVFNRTSGTLQVVKQEISSEGVETVRWFLRRLPSRTGETPPLLGYELHPYIELIGASGSLVVREHKDQRSRSIKVELTEGDIEYIWWLS